MADELLFSNYGVEIFKRDEKFFIRYNARGIVVQMREDEVTEEEAMKAQTWE
ncbi:hypothetical protein ACFQZT_19995 [Paenibacillus sp. GCM10027628]|uniref:hypothetical protein n=1 Tax=Paenibacillus sp. GCM10027628 TaxID=3273413 RepID=UPI003626B084